MARRRTALTALAAALILAAFSVAAHEIPLSEPVFGASGYSTEIAAVQAALQLAVANGGARFEYGGAVYELHGEFYYTAPVTICDDANDEYRIAVPPGAHVTALYHTHPATHPRSFEFSATDVTVATKNRLTSYIAVVRDGQIKRFVPGRDTPDLDDGSMGTVVAKLKYT